MCVLLDRVHEIDNELKTKQLPESKIISLKEERNKKLWLKIIQSIDELNQTVAEHAERIAHVANEH